MNKRSPASLYIGGQVVRVLCEPEGWMTIIASDNSISAGSLSLSDYSTTGVMNSLPKNVFFPLDLLQLLTANRDI